MKIESLHFKNINSLKGEHDIYFEKAPLNSGGLFAIIGPTGSGKSSLLDAICLALYGRTPRISSVNKNKIEQDGSILTKYQKEAYAKVQFSCNSGRFVSTWSISTNRNGNLREYDMELWDFETEKSFSEKKTEVLAEIQRLIGLSYDQFVKSVLLSQGDFASLLKANEKERSELLEKITNTSIYRQIGRKVYEKYNLLKSKISDKKTLLEDLESKLIHEDDLKGKEADQEKLEQKEKDVSTQLTKFKKELDQWILKEKLHKQLEEESEKLETIQTEFELFEEKNASKLKQHENTLAFEEELLEYNAFVEKKIQQENTLKDLNEDQDQLLKKLQDLKTEINTLLKTQVKEEDVEQSLEKLLKTYQDLSYKRQLKLNEYKSKIQIVNKELTALKLEFSNQPIDEFIKELKNLEKLSRQKIEDLDLKLTEIDSIESSLNKQKDVLDKIKEAKYEDRFISELKAKLTQLEEQIETDRKELSAYPQLLLNKTSKLKSLEKEMDVLNTKKENQQLRLQVEDLRQALELNSPCPVCGSTTHPYSDHQPLVDSELGLKLKEVKQQLQLCTKEIETLKAQQHLKEEHLKALEKENKQTKESFKNKTENFTSAYDTIIDQLEGKSFDDLEKSTRQYIHNLELTRHNLITIDAIENALITLEDLRHIKEVGRQLKAEILNLYDGKALEPVVSELKKNWITLHSNLSTTKASLEKEAFQLKTISTKLIQLQEDLKPKVEASQFSSISEANSYRIKSIDYQRLSRQQSDLSERIQVQLKGVKGLELQLKDLKSDIFKNKTEVETSILNVELDLKTTRNELEEIRRELKNNLELKQELEAIKNTIAADLKANKKWELLNTLIGDAEGHKFNKFAQDLSLQRLIHLGNKRLKHLNERYELDRYLPQEDKDQLYVIDNHMGGLRRSVKTLSGGETFLMSLALALGLSDLASKNVEINSLFIDEGFGTLDPETLDLTLDTLERLQAESNKTIGIISHVGALKERIQTQIVLDRNAQGYSRLNVIG